MINDGRHHKTIITEIYAITRKIVPHPVLAEVYTLLGQLRIVLGSNLTHE